MEYYTYAYLREDGSPYYIGKGKDRRAYTKHPGHTVPSEDRILFLKKNLTEDQAFKHEVYMISVFGRKDLGTGILRNKSEGGIGGDTGYFGTERHREDARKRTGEKNPFYGKTHTEESKKIMSENLKGRKAWNKGKVSSDNPHAAYMRAYRARKNML